jgi:hypothetical protein
MKKRLTLPLLMILNGNLFFLLFISILPFLHFHFLLSFPLFYASQFEEECWNSHKLLRISHAYVILAYRTMSLSYASLIRLPTSSIGQTKYILRILPPALSS